ncbi:toxin [Bacillus sp. CGMCC 1.16541]|uniref:anthrax toxin lethal factor-related metalloendopeptidase n=1 Tax=Bacillus sp. CGMCC 1.16541 TaxID=2185143 RepID=UPI000D73EC70|nr:toxin [Bacillus sp. CGMCC 1.16541]
MNARIVVLLLLILFISPIITYSSFERDSIALGDTSLANDITYERKQVSYYVERIIYLPKESYNKKDVELMVKRIAAINPFLLEQMYKKHVRMKFFTGKLTNEPAFSHLKGVKPRGYSESGPTWDDIPGAGGSTTVYVKIGHSDKGNGHGSVNLELHELGHTIDQHVLNGIRRNKDFLTHWQNERNQLFPNKAYFLLYPEEYFAEVFAMYYTNELTRRRLQALAPNTYSYLEQILEIYPVPKGKNLFSMSTIK